MPLFSAATRHWQQLLAISDRQIARMRPGNTPRACTDHFEPADFELNPANRLVLKGCAVPSKNLNLEEHAHPDPPPSPEDNRDLFPHPQDEQAGPLTPTLPVCTPLPLYEDSDSEELCAYEDSRDSEDDDPTWSESTSAQGSQQVQESESEYFDSEGSSSDQTNNAYIVPETQIKKLIASFACKTCGSPIFFDDIASTPRLGCVLELK